jgi:hypothetical protein
LSARPPEVLRAWSMTMRASTATAPVFVHDDGVDVHLAQLRQLAHHFRHAQQHLLQRVHVDRLAPRHSPSVSATRERSISRRARNWFSGGSSMARSLISSIMVPPAPKVITGPNGSSVTRPM